jgi:hypothetical protein
VSAGRDPKTSEEHCPKLELVSALGHSEDY